MGTKIECLRRKDIVLVEHKNEGAIFKTREQQNTKRHKKLWNIILNKRNKSFVKKELIIICWGTTKEDHQTSRNEKKLVN
jgi:hypothetical protein